ncbi:MAG: anthranilate synthase component I [Fimbriimonadales bacterium]|nr:anthranilate synthase component I [Fimbriimonadales bacterium]
MIVPSREDFLRHAHEGRRMPVHADLLADMETPLSAYWKLAHDEPHSFLLESVTGGEHLARYSMIGVRPRLVLRTKGRMVRRITHTGETRSHLPDGFDPLHLLEQELTAEPVLDQPGLPRFVGGAVGMLSYDLVRFFERLPDNGVDDLDCDDLAMMLVDSAVVFDHAKNLIRVVVLADGTSRAYEQAAAEIERIVARLRRPLPPLPMGRFEAHPLASNMAEGEYEEGVRRVVELIAAGDGVQMVLSQRFQTQTEAHPLTIYRALRSLNPSPYMFLLRYGDFDVVGASPELLVGLEHGVAKVRPIAGTRHRGESLEDDARLERELLADEKERAEHVMLVDLGRNDLGRVCEFGSVRVDELMTVERYSHVMHIVSSVSGRLAKGKSAYDLVRATFPAGTVSGAPKIRAMEVIDEIEPTRRGLYAGAIGYFGASGDMDLCIAIRTILLKSHTAYVQAGAGIVFDSVPERESMECRNKAMACLRAIELAQKGLQAAL